MHVLIVDDQKAVQSALQLLFEVHDVACLTADSPAAALDLVCREDVGAVIQDMNFSRDTTSGEEGVALFREIRKLDPDLPVILLTAWTSLETAVQLTKEGAHDYLPKPWDDAKLRTVVSSALRLRMAALENNRRRAEERTARSNLEQRFDLRGLIYASRCMHDLLTLATRVAPSDVPVLITGPNGSGKERIAQIVQANSRRANKPLISVNAGGLPDQLLEAELFGAEPGSFTGATKLRIGRFEAADGGTLFLDELGNLSLGAQMKLLRVLQTGEYQRLGSNQTRKADVRIISATNADLRAQIAAGTFREDLYFRLNVIELEVPALATRRSDILPLALHFLKAADDSGERRFSSAAVVALEEHDFPGNVRELENRIRRAVLVGSPEISARDLDLGAGSRASARPIRAGASEGEEKPTSGEADAKARQDSATDLATSAAPSELGPLEIAERSVIEAALGRANGVVARAANELGLSRQALYRRMERLGLSIERRVR